MMLTNDSIHRHTAYIRSLDVRSDRLDYWLGAHLRVSGVYWALSALLVANPGLTATDSRFDDVAPRSRAALVDFILDECMRADGSFGGARGHAGHLTFTLSAVQSLAMLGALCDERFNPERTAAWVASRQDIASGAFTGDACGERDTRFTYCALATLAILDRLAAVDCVRAVEYVTACRNADGGYGATPGAESHAGQVFCCVGALSILDRAGALPTVSHRDMLRDDRLAEWLAWRQLPCGGLNGRPEKFEDVCYSWWVLASLAMLDRVHWVDGDALASFIDSCADMPAGGFADRPGDVADIFHTLFALAGLSLLQHAKAVNVPLPPLAPVDAVFCMPAFTLPAHLSLMRR